MYIILYGIHCFVGRQNPLADPWIVPVIQGYVHIQMCRLTFEDQYSSMHEPQSQQQQQHDHSAYEPVEYKLCLVSRRSRHRAGRSAASRVLLLL